MGDVLTEGLATKVVQKMQKQNRNKRKGFDTADKAKAEAAFYAANISDEYNQPMSILGSSTSYFNRYGESLRIYFSFMEQFIWVSLAIGILALI